MSIIFSPERLLYRGHFLSLRADRQPDGKYLARASIIFIGAEMTVSQRFLDLDTFDSENRALECAQSAAEAWVDRECADEPLRFGVSLPIRG